MDKFIIIFYNLLILLFPYSIKFHGITYSKLVFLISVVLTIYLVFKKKINKDIFKNKIVKYLSIGFLSFFIAVTISTCVNSMLDKKIVLSNFFEILRVVEYYLIIINYYVLLSDKKILKIFNISFICIFVVSFIISIFQFHNFFGLNEHYVKIIAPTQFKNLVNGYKHPRAVALIGNPNELGMYMTLGALYMLHLVIKNYKKWYFYLFYLLFTFSVFLSSSRTSYISLIFGSGMLIIFHFFKFNKEGFFKTLKFGIILIVFQLLLLFLLPNIYTWRIKTIFNINEQESWQKRVDLSKELYDDIFNDNNETEEFDSNNENDNNVVNNIKHNKTLSIIIGNGPDKMKEKYVEYFDNEWNKLIFNFGIFGLLTFVFMILSPFITVIKNHKFDLKLYGAIVLASFVYMITAAIYNNYMLFSLFCILMVISLLEENKAVKNKSK